MGGQQDWAVDAGASLLEDALYGAGLGVWEWIPGTGRAGFCGRAAWLLGYPSDRMLASQEQWLERIVPEDRERFRRALQAHLAGRQPRFRCEHRVRLPGGEIRWLRATGASIRGPDGRVRAVRGLLADIHEDQTAREQLMRGAFRDGLTGLANRALFLDRTERCIRRWRRKRVPFAILYADLDGFKPVNDRWGHETGDRVLAEMARRIEGSLRPGDTVARLGGDEFAILLEDLTGPEDAVRVAGRVQAAIDRPLRIGATTVALSVSLGIAHQSGGYQSAAELLRDADAAMYRAKRADKARCVVFDDHVGERIGRRLEMETVLRDALRADAVAFDFRPVLQLRTGMIGNWRLEPVFPKLAEATPDSWASVVESGPWGIQLGMRLFEQACRTVTRWPRLAGKDRAVSVRLPRIVWEAGDAPERMANLAREAGARPSALELLIPEFLLIRGDWHELLDAVRRIGFRIAVDDFGSGQASLHPLRALPVDGLTIDPQLVSRLGTDKYADDMVRMILQLGPVLRRPITARGVTTQEQLRLLEELGCEEAEISDAELARERMPRLAA